MIVRSTEREGSILAVLKALEAQGHLSRMRAEQRNQSLNQQKFRESFAQDVDPLEASIMATVQKPGNVNLFADPTTAVAWKTLPSWYLISTNDRMIPPFVQQMFASRMKAKTISVPSSHASIVSHPFEVFELIQAAAKVGANT